MVWKHYAAATVRYLREKKVVYKLPWKKYMFTALQLKQFVLQICVENESFTLNAVELEGVKCLPLEIRM